MHQQGDGADNATYRVVAASWLEALQQVRAELGDVSPMSGFTIALSDRGCSATDADARRQFIVNEEPAPLPDPDGAAPTIPNTGDVFQVLQSRSHDATESVPLTVREVVYLLSSPDAEDQIDAFVRQELATFQSQIANCGTRKLIRLAVVDATTTTLLANPPILTLEWKDWSDTLHIQRHRQPAEAHSVPEPDPSDSRASSRVDDLADVFEQMHSLHLLADPLEGGDYCIDIAAATLRADGVFLHFFDVERRAWVLACSNAPSSDKLLGVRTSSEDRILAQCIEGAPQPYAVNSIDMRSTPHERHRFFETAFRVLCAPLTVGPRRSLGVIEVIRASANPAYTDEEASALAYIAAQCTNFLSSRGIVLDTDRIRRHGRWRSENV